MVKEGERSKLGSIAAASPPLIKPHNGGVPKPSGSDWTRYPLRLRSPDLSSCHVCSSQIHFKGGKDKLQTLDSQWRIVIICNNCFNNVQSAKSCSYCFSEFSEPGISCRICNRRVHQGCMSMYGRLNSWSDLGSFACIDCWIPKSFKKFDCKGKSNGRIRVKSKNSISRVSSDLKSCSKSLEDAVKDAKSNAEVKLANAARARETASKKAVAARQAAEMAANVLDLAVVAATEESQVGGSCTLVDDAELALRLHRAINSSPRIFRNVRSIKLDNLVKNKMNYASSIATNSEPGDEIVCDIEVGTDKLKIENPDKAISELSVKIGNLDHGSCNDLSALVHGTDMESWGSHEECRRNCEVAGMINSEGISDSHHPKIFNDQDFVLELPTKEEQASCSSKITISSGNHNSADSRSQCCQNQEVTNQNQDQSVYEKDSSLLGYENNHGPDMFLKKYTKKRVIISSGCHNSADFRSQCCQNQEVTNHNHDQSLYDKDSSLLGFENNRGPDMFLKKYTKKRVTVSSGNCNSADSRSQCCQNQEVRNHNQDQSVYEKDFSLLGYENNHGSDMFLKKYTKKRVTNSSGNYNIVDSRSQCCQNEEVTNHNQDQSLYEKDSSLLEYENNRGPDMFLKKYTKKRCRREKMYTRKYNRGHMKSKGMFDRNAKFYPKSLHLESQTSVTALPPAPTQVNITDVLTSSETFVQVPSVPSQASTSASNQY